MGYPISTTSTSVFNFFGDPKNVEVRLFAFDVPSGLISVAPI
jgi:hypothetical protein